MCKNVRSIKVKCFRFVASLCLSIVISDGKETKQTFQTSAGVEPNPSRLAPTTQLSHSSSKRIQSVISVIFSDTNTDLYILRQSVKSLK